MAGRKYPKIIYQNFEFKIRRSNSTEQLTTWICTQEGCKVRMKSQGKCIYMKDICHTHGPTYKGDYNNLKSQLVNVQLYP